MGHSISLAHSLSSILFFLNFYITFSSSFSSNFSSSPHLCAHDQKLSLLQFKETFSINSSASSWEGCQYPKTESWKEGVDCCLWDGVTCDMRTGLVNELNLACSMLFGTLHFNNSLFSLHHLRKLDLSYNDFNSSHISSQFGQFSDLTHLNLSYSIFNGQVPSEISHLSKLVSLDLSENELTLEQISFDKLVQKLSKLRQLHLSSVNMSLVTSTSSLMNLSSTLSSLKLSSCGLHGKFPSEISHLSNLVSLDLSDNCLSLDQITFDNLVQNLTNLREMHLSKVNMSFIVPNSLSNLSSSLSSLFLSNCGLQGKFPGNFFLRTNLEKLHLSDNQGLIGSFPSSNASSVLVELGLSNTKISVSLENDFLNNLKSLKHLFLRNCNIVLSNVALLGSRTQLISLDLSGNNFSRQIPSSFGNLVKLKYLNLSVNSFTGRIPESLSALTHIEIFDLSHNQLLGTIPSFLFALRSLWYLDLHNNQFIGNLSEFQYNSLGYLDLSNNNLHGPIPSSFFKQENMQVLILASNNKLTGEISSSICRLQFLQVLDLSNNSMVGSIPQCLGNFSNRLSVLHLRMNNLQGTIPSTFLEGNSLRYLNLCGNSLVGGIPTSIINCTKLEVLDFAYNMIEDTFPYFLEALPELQILVLKSNKLQGSMKSPTICHAFSKLLILDLSGNNLSGSLPTGHFNSFEAMMNSDQDFKYMGEFYSNVYYFSVRSTWKGSEIVFPQIHTTVKFIDLSGNNFTGKMPKLIGKLKALKQLNLSHNSLTGYIQPSLGNLTNLESLDLSSNLFAGRVPVQLADLTFLGVLNLSYNQFEGPVPQGKQFNTFGPGSFEGNPGLCGFPMPKECSSGKATLLPPSKFHEGDDSTIMFEDGFGWKAVAMGYGCGFVFGVTMGYISFKTRKPAWLLRLVEVQWNLKAKGMKKNAHRSGERRN